MQGIIYNQDADSLIYGVGKNGCKLTVEQMKNYASQFKGSHMTDIMLCLNNSCASYPSEVITSFIDKYHQKLENGVPVDYTSEPSIMGFHHIFETLGIDHIAIEIDTFREIGINPWISFRMNDYHDRHAETSSQLPDYYHEHPEIRRGTYKPKKYQYQWDKNNDYAHPFVREMMLAFIEEALERYDPYGVELDYTRELLVFKDGEEMDGIEIMNEFVRSVHALCQKYGEKYGHKIKLAVRVAPQVEQNYDFGLDVVHWASERLLDLVTVSGRFDSNHNDMPIKLWKSLLAPFGVELAAGIEMYIRPHWDADPVLPSISTMAALAASAYSQGADKIYMYNFFHRFDSPHIDPYAPIPEDTETFGDFSGFYGTFGSLEKLLKFDRRHIISINDRLPWWQRNRGYDQLPTTFDEERFFKITVGEIPEGAKVQIRMGFGCSTEKVLENPVTVYLNGERCTYVGAEQDNRYARETVLCYDALAAAHRSSAVAFVIGNEKLVAEGYRTTIDYFEVYIKAPV